MHRTIIAAAAAFLVLGATPALAAEQEKARSQHTAADIKAAKPNATVEVEAEQLRLLLGGARGKGVLNYQGKTYPFTIKAASVGGVGYNKVNAVGNVLFLNRLEDFPGTYSAISAGATVGKGAGASQFENTKGVLLDMRSKSEGLALTLGIGAAEVEFVK
jgi:hypothetical protein